VAAQRQQLVDVETSFAPLPVHRAAYCPAEPVGPAALADLAEHTYGDSDPFAAPAGEEPVRVERSGDEFVLSLLLPLAERELTELVRVRDDLVVTVGGRRRVLALPSALRRCTVAGAVLRDGRLRVRFEPDPEQWRAL
jgi:arsenite-transporting ATPase